MRRLLFLACCAVFFLPEPARAASVQEGVTVSPNALYAARTDLEAFFGPRHFFFFSIPDWPEWLSWTRFF